MNLFKFVRTCLKQNGFDSDVIARRSSNDKLSTGYFSRLAAILLDSQETQKMKKLGVRILKLNYTLTSAVNKT